MVVCRTVVGKLVLARFRYDQPYPPLGLCDTLGSVWTLESRFSVKSHGLTIGEAVKAVDFRRWFCL